MSFEFDPLGSDLPELPEFGRIETQDTGKHGESKVAIRIDHDLCESTGACAEVCPEDVIEHHHGNTSVVKPEACTECWICVENCVSGAIDIT